MFFVLEMVVRLRDAGWRPREFPGQPLECVRQRSRRALTPAGLRSRDHPAAARKIGSAGASIAPCQPVTAGRPHAAAVACLNGRYRLRSSGSWAPGHVLIRLRACGSNPSIVCPAATTRPSRPATVGAAPNRRTRVTTRLISTAPAVRPGTGGAKPPGVICCQVVHQPTTVTVSALLSNDDAAGSTGRPGCWRCRPPWWRYQCRRWQCAKSRTRRRCRCRWFRRQGGYDPAAVAATPRRRRRC